MKAENLESLRWYSGRLMAYSGLEGQTRYATSLVAATGRSNNLDIKLPEPANLKFGLVHERSAFGGDFFWLKGKSSTGKALKVKGCFADCHHLLINDPGCVCSLEQPESKYRSIRAGDNMLVGLASEFEPALAEKPFNDLWDNYVKWFEDLPLKETCDKLRNHTLARAVCLMKTQVYSPDEKIKKRWTTPDRWPHQKMWLWDSAFHAIGWRHLDCSLAKEILEAVLDCADEEGFIPHMMSPDYFSTITQPPVLALAANELLAYGADTGWLEKVYPPLAAYVKWDLENRDTDGDGLVEWFIEEDMNCRSGESGMDNSTRFDSALQLGAVDFNSFLCNESRLLAEMAGKLGKTDDEENWGRESQRLNSLIGEKMYNADKGFYFDYDAQTQKQTGIMASSGFLPLLCDISAEMAGSLADHLDNPETFLTPFPIASIVESAGKHSTDMWRGPSWICINWLVSEGLRKHGFAKQANKLVKKTIEEIERWFYNYGVFFEYYDDEGNCPPPRLMRKGKVAEEYDPEPHPHQAIKDFGWSATLYLDLVTRYGGDV